MNDEQFNQFRTAMTDACDAFVADGGTLITHEFGRKSTKRCCPIEALTEGRDKQGMFPEIITKHLGFAVSSEDMWVFIDGFDGVELREERRQQPMYLLGQELRAKYLTKA
jgi:hypothetical protein